jgi:Peptidase family S41
MFYNADQGSERQPAGREISWEVNMAERIFACLLRLYLRHFREEYGPECLELFRDRARDEAGCWRSTRLWFDLLFDFAASLPRTYLDRPMQQVSEFCSDSGPRFIVFADPQPPWRSLLVGAVLSFIALASFPAWISQFGVSSAPGASNFAESGEYANGLWRTTRAQGGCSGVARARAGAAGSAFDRDARQRILVQAVAYLNQFYIDRPVARKTGAAVLANEADGKDESARDPAAFARIVTGQMWEASDDHDLELVYSAEPIPNFSTTPTPSALPPSASYRAAMLRNNCGFEKVELLPDKIGYIKLNSFPELSVCRAKAVAALSKVNTARAVIFDLRENRGGMGDMTAFIASYLFDHPEYWYSPRDHTTRESWLRSPVAGSKLAAKPVYVLTSRHTISAAEQFTYNLKMLKRATIVGETTAGRAHAGVFHRIDEHFGVAITEVKSINPYSQYDWNGTGIEPDVKTPATDALNVAVRLIGKPSGKK